MGKFIDSILGKLGFTKTKNAQSVLMNFLNGTGPLYSQYGDDIYAYEVVQQAMQSIVTELSKAFITHIKVVNGEEQFIYDNVQRVLENPNPLMTMSDYIEKLGWNLLFNENAFSWPTYTKDGRLVSLTPIQPTEVEFRQYPDDSIWVHMWFRNGSEGEVPYSRLIHIRRKFSVNDVMGGNKYGKPDNKALLKTLKLNETILDNLAKALQFSMKINGVMKFKSQVNKDDQLKWLADFEQKIAQYDAAILPTDLNNDYIPINKQIQFLDQATLDFIDKKILRYWGVPLCIVEGDYNTTQFNAFYQKVLEPILIKMEQAHTKALFTGKESFGYGHKIRFYPEDCVHLDVDQKLKLFDMLVDTSSCFKNELRTKFGMRPENVFNGQIAMSSNKQNAENNSNNSGGEANE